jgi:arylsulfatase A-like enzyme
MQPNIIFILVDELRYPVHFPAGVTTADQFLQKFMPNLHRLLWEPGVRFHNYYTASTDCTPGRGTIVTGLYAQQTFCMATRANSSHPQGTTAPQPPLSPLFPTYGKVLRAAGYDTPYIGKWHLSDFPASPESGAAPSYLSDYGFQGLTIPDAVGLPAQGLGSTPGAKPPSGSTPPPSDSTIANQAVTWLQAREHYGDTRPFCLTVGFVNPHDKQFFWGGIEASRYIGMYAAAGLTPGLAYTFDVVGQMYPPDYGYAMPDNWQATAQKDEPALHEVFRGVTDGLVGGISTDPGETRFTMRDSPSKAYSGLAFAPWSYWTRALDMYTLAMTQVDLQIGQVVQNIPPSLRENTVIVFTSDHGEYASSHGLQGKGMTVYNENMRLPFIVRDLTGKYAAEPGDRYQFASSVDILPLFAKLGFGDDSWMKEPRFAGCYETRNDLLKVVTDDAPVKRNYALYSADEVLTADQNWLHAPEHVLGYVDAQSKLGLYSYWRDDEATPKQKGQQIEFYDYTIEGGRLELKNEPKKGTALADKMRTDYVPSEVQRPLPEHYHAAQQTALEGYWKFVKTADLVSVLTAMNG